MGLFPSHSPAPQELLLAPALLEQLTCAPGSRELGRILTAPRGQQPALQGYRDAVCSGQAAARARRFSGLASELRRQLDAARIAQQVRRSCRAGPPGPGAGRPPPVMPCLAPSTCPVSSPVCAIHPAPGAPLAPWLQTLPQPSAPACALPLESSLFPAKLSHTHVREPPAHPLPSASNAHMLHFSSAGPGCP